MKKCKCYEMLCVYGCENYNVCLTIDSSWRFCVSRRLRGIRHVLSRPKLRLDNMLNCWGLETVTSKIQVQIRAQSLFYIFEETAGWFARLIYKKWCRSRESNPDGGVSEGFRDQRKKNNSVWFYLLLVCHLFSGLYQANFPRIRNENFAFRSLGIHAR